MNKKGHVINGLLLGIGLGFVFEPSGSVETLRTVTAVTIPVVLGALFPDVDTDFGKHRKTLHNVWILGLFVGFPLYFANLQFVWIGVLTHFVLDFLGSKRGLALFYPLTSSEFDFPLGVRTSSGYADLVTLLITGFELALAALIVHVLPQYIGGPLPSALPIPALG